MGEYSKAEVDGNLMVITINRPDVYNALHPMASEELSGHFDEFTNNPDLWVAIVTGAGDKAFCAGNDLKYHSDLVKQTGKRPIHPTVTGFGGITARSDVYKPIIAAVNGVAMGGGFEIALSCDIIVASQNAKFALPEPRVGLAAGAGGMQRLARQIPLKKAMGMLLTGRHVSAQEGFDLGFVTALADEGKALEEAKKWAAQILECSPLSVRATKEVAMRSLDISSLESALKNPRYPGYVSLAASEDYVEGPRAFAEKRKPNWKGR